MPSKIEPGKRFGNYEIRSLLGEGGMAQVYLAHDLRHDRPVAIKFLNTKLTAPSASERFQREIQIAARLNHPHIVPLHDSGIEDDQLFYVMPYVTGESLHARLNRERSLPLSEAIKLTSQVAGALAYAHEEGLIHRDIKPANILMSHGDALVADFGIAKALTSEKVVGLTMEGTIVGTPAYMSPEQFEQEAEIDGRSDIYSLGCVFYEMLAGRPPFVGGVHLLAHQHVSTAAPPITEFRRDIPEDVCRALEKALAKRPSDRFSTAAELVDAISFDSTSVATAKFKTSTHTTPTNLPPERTRFIGRLEELSQCVTLIETERLLTLTGLGGAGKTRLALKIAEGYSRRDKPKALSFPDGVWFVDLSPLTDGGRVVDTIAQVLGVVQNADQDVTQLLLDHINKKRMLLVIDNCEHLAEACATIVDKMLNVESEVRIVATSREGLGLQGEKIFPLRPLSVPVPDENLEAIATSDSVKLFIDRAQLAHVDFAVKRDDLLDIAEICRRLDGIPLAIELAAARVRVLSVSQIRNKLNDRFRLLTSGGRTSLLRHQTLHAVIQWSYEHLSDDERAMMRMLSVFSGGWTLELAVELASTESRKDEFEVLDLLTQLIRKSLVVAGSEEQGQRRYHMLETVRQFAFERVIEAGESDALRKQHLITFLKFAERAYAQRHYYQQEWSVSLETEIDNLRAALEFARVVDAEKYLELVGALAWFWQVRSHLREGREHLTSALSLTALSTAGSTISVARARALWGAAHLLSWQGDPVTAQAWMHDALAMWRELNDSSEIAFALEGIGWAQLLAGEDEKAKITFEECLRLQRAGGDPIAINRASVGMAQVLVALSEVEAARPMAQEIIRFSETHNDKRSEHFGWHFLADCALIVGDCKESLELYKRSLIVAQELGDQLETSFEVQGVAMSLAGLALGNRAVLRPGALELARKSVLLASAAQAEWDRIGADIHIRFWDALVERYIGAVKKALGEDEVTSAMNEGRSLGFESACAIALKASPEDASLESHLS